MSKPNIDLTNQVIKFVHDNQTPLPNFTGAVVQIKSEGSMQYGPSFQSIESISQFINGKLHGDSYLNESKSRETYTITNHDSGNLVSENTFKGGSNNIREFRQNNYGENPNSLLDTITFNIHDLEPSLTSKSQPESIGWHMHTTYKHSTILNIKSSHVDTPIKIHTEVLEERPASGPNNQKSRHNFSNVYFTYGNQNLKDINHDMAEDLRKKFINMFGGTYHKNTDALINQRIRNFEENHSSELTNFTEDNSHTLNIKYITDEEYNDMPNADNLSISDYRHKQLKDAKEKDFDTQTRRLPTLNEALQASYPDDQQISKLAKPMYSDGESLLTSSWYKKVNDLPRKPPEPHFLTHYFADLASLPTNQQSQKEEYILEESIALENIIQTSELNDSQKEIAEDAIRLILGSKRNVINSTKEFFEKIKTSLSGIHSWSILQVQQILDAKNQSANDPEPDQTSGRYLPPGLIDKSTVMRRKSQASANSRVTQSSTNSQLKGHL